MKNNWRDGTLKYRTLFVLFISWGTMTISCSGKQNKPSLHLTNTIKTVQVTRKDFVRKVTGYGYVKAAQRRDIIAHTKGIVKQVWVKDGDRVTKGESLFIIRGTCSSPDMARIKREMEIADAELNFQQKEYQRIKAIKKAGGSSQKEVDKNYAKYKKALSAFNAAKGQYDYYTEGRIITAPINGYVTSLIKFPGNAVKPGELLVSIVDLKNLLVEVEVYGALADSIKPGQSAIIMVNNKLFSGRVSFISPEIERNTGSRRIGIDILQKNSAKLLPGDFVKADIIVEKHLSSLAIPEEALLNDGTQNVVMVKKGQSYKKCPVVVGLFNQGYVEVLKGLSEGEEVVTVGAYELLNRGIVKKMKVGD